MQPVKLEDYRRRDRHGNLQLMTPEGAAQFVIRAWRKERSIGQIQAMLLLREVRLSKPVISRAILAYISVATENRHKWLMGKRHV